MRYNFYLKHFLIKCRENDLKRKNSGNSKNSGLVPPVDQLAQVGEVGSFSMLFSTIK